MNDNDLINERIYGKFQPRMPATFSLPKQTRLYTEYDQSGFYVEYASTDKIVIVKTGSIEPPEKDYPVWSLVA